MPVVIDLETHRIRTGYLAPKPVCISWCDSKGNVNEATLNSAAMIVDVFTEFPNRTWAGHNICFDMAVLLEHYPDLRSTIWKAYEEGRVQCTKVREKLLDIAAGNVPLGKGHYSLEKIAARHLGIVLDKDTWRTNYHLLENLPINEWPPGAIQYAKMDATTTMALYQHQEERIQDYAAFEKEAARQAAFDFALYLTSCRGLSVDPDRTRQLRDRLHERRVSLMADMVDGEILRADGTKNMAAIKHRVEIALGDKTPKTKPTKKFPEGSTKTNQETLAKCVNDEVLRALSAYSLVSHGISTFLNRFEAALDAHGILHPSYDVLKNTGRTSSYNPNVQQMPREPGYRECLRARSGYWLIACDYDTQELRVLAQVCLDILGQSRLAEEFQKNPGFDPHQTFADGLPGFDRQAAKAANFGFPGGLGAKTFVAYARGMNVRLTLEESHALRVAWFKQWPEMDAYFSHINQVSAGGHGTMEQLRSKRLRGGVSFTQCANSYFQGLAADASKTALWGVAKACFTGQGHFEGSRPVAFIHDEIIIETPEDHTVFASEDLEFIMVNAMQKWTPDIPVRATAKVMKNWSKE